MSTTRKRYVLRKFLTTIQYNSFDILNTYPNSLCGDYKLFSHVNVVDTKMSVPFIIMPPHIAEDSSVSQYIIYFLQSRSA